ncbi:hypothetical protein [Sciscionella sediminilitoris]|uniref:hypothetical protein n=1 Tax=Sciscionella sediminilitoris TaxID=1445613 RepID=UPI0004DFBD85|nr:hypothetical protein [Sciscionella sp. SE31]
MTEQVDVERLNGDSCAVTIRRGVATTHHRVTMSGELFDDLLLPRTAATHVVEQTMRYLLERRSAGSIPHDIDLDELREHDARYLTALRKRLAG